MKQQKRKNTSGDAILTSQEFEVNGTLIQWSYLQTLTNVNCLIRIYTDNILPLWSAHRIWCPACTWWCTDTRQSPWIRLPSATCWLESCFSPRTLPRSCPGYWSGRPVWSSSCGCAISVLVKVGWKHLKYCVCRLTHREVEIYRGTVHLT